jgi:hypothetical protein
MKRLHRGNDGRQVKIELFVQCQLNALLGGQVLA